MICYLKTYFSKLLGQGCWCGVLPLGTGILVDVDSDTFKIFGTRLGILKDKKKKKVFLVQLCKKSFFFFLLNSEDYN